MGTTRLKSEEKLFLHFFFKVIMEAGIEIALFIIKKKINYYHILFPETNQIAS